MRIPFAVGRVRRGGADIVFVREEERLKPLPGPWGLLAVIIQGIRPAR